MPAKYTTITKVLARRLAAVPKVGRVHAFRYFPTRGDEFRAAFTDPAQQTICAWTISRESFVDEQVATGNENIRRSVYVLRGFRGLENETESETTFQALLDAVADAFHPQDNLDETVELIEPVQARSISLLNLEGIGVCHYCELTLTVQEYYMP